MNALRSAIEAALNEAGIEAGILRLRELTGGCIHQVMRAELSSGTSVVAKVSSSARAALFLEEAHALERLRATTTVRTPTILANTQSGETAVLLLEWLEPAVADEAAWRACGESLAALHRAPVGESYGFEIENHLGTTPQPNTWRDDWVEFNCEHRLGYQIRRAQDPSLLASSEVNRIGQLISRLGEFIPRKPRASLLHGDLWSGNALACRSHDANHAVIAVIDPACSIGDGWADIAMMQLFGGFPAPCFEAYGAHIGDAAAHANRIAIYQLYHLLNHVNLFGHSYVSQVMSRLAVLGF